LDPEIKSALRRELPGLEGTLYLNTGTLGPSPRRVTERLFQLYREWQERGPGNPEVYQAAHAETRKAAERVASFVGVQGDELALTGNATDGINIVANGIEWKAGDEVVISDQEHPAGLLIWLHLRQTKGIRVRIARLSADGRLRNVEEVASLLTPRTRLVALSHVTCMTGLRLPAREITEAAHARGVPILFDGAQSAGQFPLDLRALGCDFYALNGHKWLLGPVGTGALYVSRTALVDLRPDRVGGGSTDQFRYAEDGPLAFPATATRFEFGTRCYPLHSVWPEALAFLEEVGLAVIREESLRLSMLLRRELAAIPGVTVLGPSGDPELMTGMVTCRVAGYTGQGLYEALLKRFGVVSRPVVELEATRFSTAFFNTEEEIAQAAGAVAVLAREAA